MPPAGMPGRSLTLGVDLFQVLDQLGLRVERRTVQGRRYVVIGRRTCAGEELVDRPSPKHFTHGHQHTVLLLAAAGGTAE